jgi:hypothetical protein
MISTKTIKSQGSAWMHGGIAYKGLDTLLEVTRRGLRELKIASSHCGIASPHVARCRHRLSFGYRRIDWWNPELQLAYPRGGPTVIGLL